VLQSNRAVGAQPGTKIEIETQLKIEIGSQKSKFEIGSNLKISSWFEINVN
jgi:hypothetical protein